MPDPPLVVVVDDEPDILLSLQDLLEGGLGYTTLTASSGPDALRLLAAIREHGVDLLVADYQMQPMDGIRLVQEARALHPGLPAILCTAYPDLGVALAAVNTARVDRFLTKPFEAQGFLATIQELVRGRRRSLDVTAALRRAARSG